MPRAFGLFSCQYVKQTKHRKTVVFADFSSFLGENSHLALWAAKKPSYFDMSERHMQYTNNTVYIFLEFHIMEGMNFYEERSVASK